MSRTIRGLSFLRFPNLESTKLRKISPISLKDWPKYTYTNCFGFAIGYSEQLEFWEVEMFNMDPSLRIEEAFLEKMRELGYELPRRIFTLSEANADEHVLAVFGFVSYQLKFSFMRTRNVDDYHVVRRELDRTWVHKPGWDQEPRIVTSEDAALIQQVFNADKVALFAVKAQSE